MAVDPRDPRHVYAAGPGGIFRSNNAGQSWQVSSDGIEDQPIVAVALNPNAPDTIYAASTDGELFQSEDGAATWRQVGE